ncbi:MAG: type II secretion system F family protein [Phycisphaerae bacterium]|nr:type II secretion system F family protein [Phycisphaerae bacterium]
MAKSVMLIALPLVGSILLAYGVYNAAFDLRRSARKKVISRLKGGTSRGRKHEEAFNFEDFRKHTVEVTGMLAKAFSKLRFTANLQRALDQANVNWSAAQTLVNLTALASGLLAILLVVQVPLLAALGSAAAVFILPILYLFRRRKKRLRKFVNQLPDVFELLSQALRAGHSLASGMQLVAKELPDPAGTEFGRVFHEQNLGVKIEDALRNLAERVDLLDVRFFVTAVLIQRQVGGDLAEVLDKIGNVISERIKLFGSVQALTAEGRLSGYVLLALPVIVMLAMCKVNIEYVKLLFTDPLGKMMLTTAIVMQLLGWVMIKKIVNIKV